MAEEKKDEVTTVMFGQFPNYKGEVKLAGYEGWMEFQSAQFGAGLGISSGRRWRDNDDEEDDGPEVGEDDFPERECSEPSISELTVTKKQNANSCQIFYALCSKKMLDPVILDIVEVREGKAVTVFRYHMRNVYFSGYSTSWGSNNRSSTGPTESLSLNFAAVEIVSFVNGVPASGAAYHLPSNTSTYKTGPSLEVAEKHKKEKKKKEKKGGDAAEKNENAEEKKEAAEEGKKEEASS